MKQSEQEKLLSELLPDEHLADFRRASLESGLASLRRHRRQRTLLRAGLLAAGICVLALVLHFNSPHPARNNIVAVSPPAPAPSPNHVKFITDDQLLALFPEGSVALVGKPGQQRLVFLDKPPSQTPRTPF
jgi:hypothetical protein